MMGAVAMGLERDLESACRSFVAPTLGGLIEPEAPLVPLYDELFGVYRRLRTDMRPVWRDLARSRETNHEEWSRRPLWEKVQEWFSWILRNQA